MRNKTTHIKKLLHIFAASKTANSAIFVYNIRLQRSRKNNSFLHDFTRNAKSREFVNSDEIAKGLSPFNADSIAVAVEASRIMYKRIKELIGAGETFAMETTLATRSVANLIREAQREGYYVTLLYFWLNTPDLAVERVKMRVAAGGHNIPEATIRRRYEAGIHNLFELYLPISDYWMITDNSMSPMEVIAKGFKNDKREVYNLDIFTKLEHHE